MTWIYFSLKREICFIDVIARTHRVRRNIPLCWFLGNQVSFLKLESLSTTGGDLESSGEQRGYVNGTRSECCVSCLLILGQIVASTA